MYMLIEIWLSQGDDTIDFESHSKTYGIQIRFNPEAYGIDVQMYDTAMTDDAREKLSNNKDVPTQTYAIEIFFSCAVPCSKSLLSSLWKLIGSNVSLAFDRTVARVSGFILLLATRKN